MRRTILTVLCSLVLSLGCTSPNPDQLTDQDLAPPAEADLSLPGPGDPDLLSPQGDLGDPVLSECRSLAAAVCTRLGKCSQYLLRYYYGDEKTCNERVQLTCAPYVRLTGSSWSVDRLRACTAAYGSATCDDYFAPGGPKGCHPQAGGLSDGTVCATGDQCKSAFCSTGATGCGTCVTPAKSGEACSTTRPCALGLSCANSRCAELGGAGATCGTTSAPCKSGLYCSAGKCAAALGEGKTCDPAAATPGCDGLQGLFCSTTSRKCEVYKLASSGESCGTVMTSTVLCAAGGTCGGTGTNRKCTAAARDGDACGPTAGNAQCMSPATCTSAKCAVFDPVTCK